MYEWMCGKIIVILVKLCNFVGSFVGVVMTTKRTYALWECFEFLSNWWRLKRSLIPWSYNL